MPSQELKHVRELNWAGTVRNAVPAPRHASRQRFASPRPVLANRTQTSLYVSVIKVQVLPAEQDAVSITGCTFGAKALVERLDSHLVRISGRRPVIRR
ncbi:hypothetical protein MHYP_G00284940 [Metynnis hypsauchen]